MMTTYEPGFREQAVKLAMEVGTAKAARDLGVPVNTLYTWVGRDKPDSGRTVASRGKKRQSATSDEVATLIKRNKELEKANQILQDAISFFVVSRKK